MDPPSDRVLRVGLRYGEVPQTEKLELLMVGVTASSPSAAARARVASARWATRRVT